MAEEKDIKVEEEIKEEKKAPAKKRGASKKTQTTKDSVEVEEKADKKVEEQPKKRKSAPKIDLSEMIPVRSIVFGKLVYVSKKTGIKFIWENKGDEEYIEFGELMTMKASSPKFLKSPFLIVDDEDAVEKLGLTKMYEENSMVDDLDGFFALPLSEMEEKIEKFPKGFRDVITSTANQKIKSGELYDIRKIRFLEDKLKVDLELSTD